MNESETIHDRIAQLVETFGSGKNTVFASIIGSNEANVRGYKSKVMPKFDFLEKIARNLDVNLKWLLTGEGSMFNDENKALLEVMPSDDESATIPLVDISVAAGCGGYDNPEYLEIVDSIRMPFSMIRRHAKYFCIRVKGESMAPTILDSSYVIVRLLERQEWQDMPEQHVSVISDRDGRAYIKRVKNRLREHGFITCMSDNPDKANYPNFNIQYDEINTILHAEWYFSAKMPNIHETYYKKVSDLEDKYDVLENQMSKILKSLNPLH